MKRLTAFVLAIMFAFCFVGCDEQEVKPVKTIEGNIKTYCEMSDGTWHADGYCYQYRLEIRGRLHGAVKDSVYVYLSNIEEISFQKAAMAGGLSSNMNDYFSLDEAVLVEWIVE